MAGLGNLFQKAVYLGVGLASYASDKAAENLGDLRGQAQALVDELVQRGELTTEEARRMVDDLINRSQATTVAAQPAADSKPRSIDIEVEDEPSGSATAPAQIPQASDPQAAAKHQAEELRRQVAELQAQLERLRQSES